MKKELSYFLCSKGVSHSTLTNDNMKYMGSKARYAKEILPIILKNRKPEQWYVEPFAGGMNMIDKVEGNRIANDINYELIQMWEALVNDGWTFGECDACIYYEEKRYYEYKKYTAPQSTL